MSLKTVLRTTYLKGGMKESKDSNSMDKEEIKDCYKDSPNQPPSLGIPDDTIEDIHSDFPSTENYDKKMIDNHDQFNSDSGSPLLFERPPIPNVKGMGRKIREFDIPSYSKKGHERKIDVPFQKRDRWGSISFDKESVSARKKKRMRKGNKLYLLNHTGNMYTRSLEMKYVRLLEKHIELLEEKMEKMKQKGDKIQ